jgi:hypothetical protein
VGEVTFFIGVDINSISPSIMGREDLDCGLLWQLEQGGEKGRKKRGDW